MPVLQPPFGGPVLLSSTTLGGSGTFDVSSISQAYSDLTLVILARGTDAGATDNLLLRFNNDSTANYDWQQNAFFGTSSSFSQGAAAAQIQIAVCPAAGATANYFGLFEITMPGYASTTWVKRALQPMTMYESIVGTPASCANAGLWRSTAAINRVQILGGNTANLATGSQLRIYGQL